MPRKWTRIEWRCDRRRKSKPFFVLRTKWEPRCIYDSATTFIKRIKLWWSQTDFRLAVISFAFSVLFSESAILFRMWRRPLTRSARWIRPRCYVWKFLIRAFREKRLTEIFSFYTLPAFRLPIVIFPFWAGIIIAVKVPSASFSNPIHITV